MYQNLIIACSKIFSSKEILQCFLKDRSNYFTGLISAARLLSFSCFLLILSENIFAQVETIPSGHPVYSFLKRMQVMGIIQNYDDVILPLSKQEVINLLEEIDVKKNSLTTTDQDYLKIIETKIFNNPRRTVNVFDKFPSGFINNLGGEFQKHLYNYQDSSITFFVDPIIELNYIQSDYYRNNSSIINAGGIFHGSYDGWFGYYIEGTNAAVFGNRDVAELDTRVEQSYTFNHTKINYFDGTKGYARFQKGIISLQFGRERILFGNGYINRTILSGNPPLFDFVRFDISYKKFRYDFLHSWLVQKPVQTFIDSLVGNDKQKQPKYVAISRLGYQANEKLSFGITQMIIYSGRPFEAAYLNPFLFWESAQRSMNDLDNSFLTFDGRYLITKGIEISSSIIFDDVNFHKWFGGQWENHSNGNEWQVGAIITNPLLPEELTLKIEYLQIRPYIFSHPGIGEELTYSNNGYLLGTNLQPNSVNFALELGYQLNDRILMNLLYNHSIHGANTYDANGNLVTNVGGNFLNNFTPAYDSPTISLLDGIRETADELSLNITYEFLNGFYFDFVYQFLNESSTGFSKGDNIVWISLKLNFE
ncbi:MAG: capsule assembly Wzi family protein [Ignavibacteriaceae bacterium]